MGNKQTKIHLENAAKTGVCTLANSKLEELPPELFKVWYFGAYLTFYNEFE